MLDHCNLHERLSGLLDQQPLHVEGAVVSWSIPSLWQPSVGMIADPSFNAERERSTTDPPRVSYPPGSCVLGGYRPNVVLPQFVPTFV